MMITGLTMDTTYTIQIQYDDGTWDFYSQAEYDTAESARESAAWMYSGEVPTRIVRIERHVIADDEPRIELRLNGFAEGDTLKI